MQNCPTAQPISSVDTRIDGSIAATLPLSKRSKPDWKRTSAIAGAAVTSAGMVMPLASEQAIAYEGSLNSRSTDVVQQAVSEPRTARPMASALSPQASAAKSVSFSDRGRTASRRTASTSVASTNAASTNAVSSKLGVLLSRGPGGALGLSYQTPRDASSEQVQAVLTELVSATRAQIASLPAKPERSNPKSVKSKQAIAAELAVNSTAHSKLFAARQQVQQAQQKLADFEAARGQTDMVAYRNVLASRMAEIAEQGTRLSANIERNQRILTQLKMRLLTVDADVSLPDRVLAADEEYQAVWARLQKAEQNMLEEFSAANVDGTRLNEIYGDYKYHQQWLARAAEQAFPNYVMSDSAAQIGFVAQAPTAIDAMQNLVVATHQDRVQQLRQETLDTISQRLEGRHTQLATDIGKYEQLQRELSTATEVAAGYEQSEGQRAQVARKQLAGQTGQLVSNVAAAPTEAAASENTAVSQAQLLAPYFANGTLSKTLLGIAIAAGAVASATAAHRARKSQSAKGVEPIAPGLAEPFAGSLDAFSIAPAAATSTDFSAFSLYGETAPDNEQQIEHDLLETVLSSVESEVVPPISTDALVAELLEITRGDEALAAYRLQPVSTSRTEASLVSELSEIIGETNAASGQLEVPTLTAESVEDILGVEVMTRELEEIISAPGPVLSPSRLLPAKATLSDPIKLSVKEIDLFAEQVIRWVLNDLGFQVVNSSNMAAES